MRRSPILLFCFAAILSLATVAGSANGSVVVNVNGSSGPWQYSSSLNPSFSYGLGDESAPTIVATGSGVTVAPSQELTLTYLSGLVSYHPGDTEGTGAGVTTYPVNNLGGPDGFCPSYYMPSSDYPINVVELVGTFADSSGDIVGIPFPVGLGTTLVVPSGATQLQLGVNDDAFNDNSGSFSVQIATAVPEPASGSLLLLGSGGLFLRRRKVAKWKFKMVGNN